jgi:hypothetical protein
MKKGNIVRINNKVCFTAKNGGERRFPLTNSYCDDRGFIEGTRHTEEPERDAWRKRLSEDIKSGKETWHDCAGEPHMAPRCTSVAMARDTDYVVVRARCAPVLGYHKYPGMALIVNALPLDEGKRRPFYVKRTLLEVVA